MVDVAKVKMFGMNVGTVRWDSSYEVARFEYDAQFAGKGIEVGANVSSYSSNKGIYPFVYLTQNYSKKNEVRKYFNNLEIVKDLGNNASANVEENVTYENWKSE